MSKLKFYCKADSQDLSKVGDCPFCHKVHLALNHKELSFEKILIDLKNKPQEFLDLNPKGTVPVLVVDNQPAVCDSDDVLTLIEKLSTKNEFIIDNINLKNLVSPVFMCFVQFVKSDENNRQEKKQILQNNLQLINDYIENSKLTYLNGEKICQYDFNLMPTLYHMSVVGQHYFNCNLLLNMKSIIKYKENFETLTIWKNSYYTEESIIQGWSKFFQ